MCIHIYIYIYILSPGAVRRSASGAAKPRFVSLMIIIIIMNISIMVINNTIIVKQSS